MVLRDAFSALSRRALEMQSEAWPLIFRTGNTDQSVSMKSEGASLSFVSDTQSNTVI